MCAKPGLAAVGAKGNRNLGLTFCASAALCYVRKLDRGGGSHKSPCCYVKELVEEV